MKNLIIVTSTINPVAIDVKYVNERMRKIETINSLSILIKSNLFQVIIFIDNSGYSLKKNKKIIFLLRKHKIKFIEIVYKQKSTFYKKYSGYKFMGEIHQLKLALKKMVFLDFDNIFKISGRYQIENLKTCVNDMLEFETIFFSYHLYFIKKSFLTSFYKIDKGTLGNILQYASEVYERKHDTPIEYIFASYLYEHFKANKVYKIRYIPKIIAISGTHSTAYSKFSFRNFYYRISAFIFSHAYSFTKAK